MLEDSWVRLVTLNKHYLVTLRAPVFTSAMLGKHVGGMASSSSKRINTVGAKRMEPELPYSNKFLSRIHEQHFLIVQDRRLLMERKCQFALNMEEGADFDDMESVLCVPGGHFQRNRNGAVVHIRRADLTPMAKYWMVFSHANIQPCSHVSDITVSRALFLYCVLRGMSITIENIAGEMRGQVATVEMIIGMSGTPLDNSGLWMNSTLWWHDQRSRHRLVELEQLKLQLWRKILLIAWVDEDLR
ncbi:hypothetical protein LR48_Vigan10s000300 [Vigna angularis]|uniref:Putative plant transposon protein domain-containing protein n=1 Tax=Phaseolus angularis TaxID=3914 RepID=A0A0L9T459_PHAAN|nr:hypothetical protein LR48_Vigan10s000300 [Vigna angularis]